ncbi:hypothetical protein DPEC_G00070910 [Dallia pectoralis]|uniref:Uncharacterized protein n=1 Tax=Dallia pectoralis TaxID=75939 RepID=A0ACC2H270_DALPE|nr:hypothetical protein DPEC_G00070910 [Dallia pectoralis]
MPILRAAPQRVRQTRTGEMAGDGGGGCLWVTYPHPPPPCFSGPVGHRRQQAGAGEGPWASHCLPPAPPQTSSLPLPRVLGVRRKHRLQRYDLLEEPAPLPPPRHREEGATRALRWVQQSFSGVVRSETRDTPVVGVRIRREVCTPALRRDNDIQRRSHPQEQWQGQRIGSIPSCVCACEAAPRGLLPHCVDPGPGPQRYQNPQRQKSNSSSPAPKQEAPEPGYAMLSTWFLSQSTSFRLLPLSPRERKSHSAEEYVSP